MMPRRESVVLHVDGEVATLRDQDPLFARGVHDHLYSCPTGRERGMDSPNPDHAGGVTPDPGSERGTLSEAGRPISMKRSSTDYAAALVEDMILSRIAG